MAEAKTEDTLQWVSLHEASIRVAARSAACQKPLAAYTVEQKFRNGEYHYRYRDGGVLHENDLSADFLREAVIDVAASTATRPERIERIHNPDLPLVRAGYTPQAQWIPRGSDPFSQPDYIPKTIPARTFTDIEVLVPRPTEQTAQKAPRRGRPSSAPLLLEEAAQRARSKGMESLKRQGHENFLSGLSDYLKEKHPEARPMAPKTIGDHLRNPGASAGILVPAKIIPAHICCHYSEINFGQKSPLSEQE